MFKKIIIVLLFFKFLILKAQDLPKVDTGTIVRIADFKSNYIDSRIIDIWLPDNYSIDKKYSVVYMQDGQMLFDANTTWNKQAWEIETVMSDLTQQQKINPCIVVGIWNGGKVRHATYFPKKVFNSLTCKEKEWVSTALNKAGRITGNFKPNSDNYLKFLTKELKPYIDKNFATYTDVAHTFIGGSSMGALISIYAVCEYPNIFGGAACLSTHWPGVFVAENNPVPNAFIKYLKKRLPKANSHKIYFDCGDQTLDTLYPEIQQKIDALVLSKGYDSAFYKSLFFKGKDHSEKSWAERLHIPITFLLKKND